MHSYERLLVDFLIDPLIYYSTSHSVLHTWLAIPASWAWPGAVARQRQLRLLDDHWQTAADYRHSDSGNG